MRFPMTPFQALLTEYKKTFNVANWKHQQYSCPHSLQHSNRDRDTHLVQSFTIGATPVGCNNSPSVPQPYSPAHC